MGKYGVGDYLKVIVPSLVAAFMLMFPFTYDGETTIFVALLSDMTLEALGDLLPAIIFVFIAVTAVVTVVCRIRAPAFIRDSPYWSGIFIESNFWLLVRVLGLVLAAMVYFEIGPEWVWSDDTGGAVLNDLILNLFAMFLFAGAVLPFLTDFGLLEFVGALLTPVMRPLFKLPGRSSIDCLASWVGDGTIGVALTNLQYEQGYYTQREASIIATTFSAVSITFSLIVIKQVGLIHLFVPYYLTVILCGVVAALIMPHLPPLSRKPKTYHEGTSGGSEDEIPAGYSKLQWGTRLAVERARQNSDIKQLLINGLKIVFDLWFGILPAIMAFGTVGLIIAEYTPFFEWLGAPFIPLLQLLHIPQFEEVSQTVMVGFADMFIPSLLGADVSSEMARFFIATLSVTQLVYLSEAGAVILGSKIDVNVLDLLIIYIERTLITMPIIALAAHLIF